MTPASTKPRLLIVELWGLGDLAIATPFLQAVVKKFEVTIVAKPYAKGLQSRLWPEANVLSFVAPWTAFHGKYRLYSWPWREMLRIGQNVREMHFDIGLSARWDPRDHFLLAALGAKKRLGFPRLGSGMFLTHPIPRTDPEAHRYDNWRMLANAIGLELPRRENIRAVSRNPGGRKHILVHTGAGQPIRVWPLENYRKLVDRLRRLGFPVQVACDFEQREWWVQNGEPDVDTPRNVGELFALLDQAAVFIGNDSGPGHLATFVDVPSFTIFGPQLPEWFAPLHPSAEWVSGKPCPYKPCSDYCRFPEPQCITKWTEEEIWTRIQAFMQKLNLHPGPAAPSI